MLVSTHLNFNGKCESAFEFYEKSLGGKINFKMTWGESPLAKKVPSEWSGKIIHMSLTLGDFMISGDDSPPEFFQRPQGFAITLNVASTDEAERIFKALSENASVGMPMEETFWAKRFGMVTDQFGVPWMINCAKE